MMKMQPGDIKATHANNQLLIELTDYEPATELNEGIQSFVKWYRAYYGIEDDRK